MVGALTLPGVITTTGGIIGFTTMTTRVLIIDDDRRLFELLRTYLSDHQMEARHAPDGLAGLALLEREPVDLVLLDVMMPGLDGLEVLRRLRARSTLPVIMLTARGDETDKVVGLELGADDYLAKPFGPRELLARARAVLRRGRPAVDDRRRVGSLVIDGAARTVTRDGDPIELTGLEFDLLLALASRKGRVVPRQQLLEAAGRDDATVGERTIDVHVSHLRRKLGDDSKTPRLIKTVRGIGYVLAGDDA